MKHSDSNNTTTAKKARKRLNRITKELRNSITSCSLEPYQSCNICIRSFVIIGFNTTFIYSFPDEWTHRQKLFSFFLSARRVLGINILQLIAWHVRVSRKLQCLQGNEPSTASPMQMQWLLKYSHNFLSLSSLLSPRHTTRLNPLCSYYWKNICLT